MGRKSASGGVQAKGRDRIEFTFKYEGKRYRPTIRRTPTTANLRRARIQLEAIKLRIEAGTFSFVEEFPDYRLQNNLAEVHAAKGALPTCGEIFDAYLAHCEMRVAMHDMAFSTCQSYRRLLDAIWRPQIGNETFEDVRYSRLAGIVAAHTRNKKTYNNVVSAARCAFDFGYKDQHPDGQINEVEVPYENCDGAPAMRESLISAIFASSPLPAPPHPGVFVDSFSMVFRLDD